MSLPARVMRKARASSYLVLAVAFGCFTPLVNAIQGGGQFNVTATLQSASSPSVFCRTNPGGLAFNAAVTVVCSTGAVVDISPGRAGIPWSPMHGGAYRYATQVFWNGVWVESLDDTPGTGTITSWRLVNLLNRSYVELTVGW